MPSPCTPDPIIRRMRWFDVDEVVALDRMAFGPDTWTTEFFLAQLAGPGNHFRVVRDAGTDELLGYAGLSVAGGEAEVLTIATAPTARGRGIARTLLTGLIDLARSNGAEAVYLDVRDDNSPALGLYRSLGFAELGRRPGYYHDADALVMRALLID